MPKRYNTPHRSHVVKTRLTDEEYADFTERLAPYGISQSEFLRQAIRRTTIRPVLHVSSVNDELLSAVGKLTAEYGRIGGNLNQIARTLNEWHMSGLSTSGFSMCGLPVSGDTGCGSSNMSKIVLLNLPLLSRCRCRIR